MKLTPLAKNVTELTTNDGTVVLFSYETPVAAELPAGGFVRTAKGYSQTTTKHINKWLDGRHADFVPQAEIDALA